MIFGAEEFVRLTPTNDNKPKITEIVPFKAVSDYSCLLILVLNLDYFAVAIEATSRAKSVRSLVFTAT